MVASNGFAEFLRDQLAPLGRITPMRVCSARPACSATGSCSSSKGMPVQVPKIGWGEDVGDHRV
jgi:hypothetical protein